MKLPTNIRSRLTQLGELTDENIDLVESALLLASIERPGVAKKPYLRHLERIVEEVRAYIDSSSAKGDLAQIVEALRQIIAKRYGYKGADDAFEDSDSANLMRVIDRRNGIPVALGIIYIHAARALGWFVSGLDFPARFLVRLENGSERIIIDPFGGGRVVTPKDMREIFKAVYGNQAEIKPAHYEDLDNRGILLRLQNNIKFRLIHAKRFEEALHTIETMLFFAPGEASLWREAGLLNARLDNVRESVAALEEYLRLNATDAARRRTSILLQELRGRLT